MAVPTSAQAAEFITSARYAHADLPAYAELETLFSRK